MNLSNTAAIQDRLQGLSPRKRALLALRLQKKAEARQSGSGIPRAPEAEAYPLSFAQQRLWFLDVLEPGNPFYNTRQAVCLDGPLDIAVMERGIGGIVDRHAVLRTRFRAVDGKPEQVVSQRGAGPMPLVDLCRLDPAVRESHGRTLAEAEGNRAFDLTEGGLLRVCFLRLGADSHAILLTMHHIVSDGWSMEVLIRELAWSYADLCAGGSGSLPELPIRYADFAVWQRQWLSGERLEAQLDYWRGQLADLPRLILPVDRPRPAVQSFRGARRNFAFSPGLSASVKALSRDRGVTVFTILMAGFQMMLFRYSGQHDVVVGTDVANRNRPEIEPLIGFFVNQLVLRGDLSGDPDFQTLLSRFRRVVLDAQANQDLPFERLVETLRPERTLSRNPLFQVKLLYQRETAGAASFSSLSPRPMAVAATKANFDITLVVTETPEMLIGSVEYATDIFDATTIQRMLTHWRRLLEDALARSHRPLSALRMPTPAEHAQILLEWNDRAGVPDSGPCVHRLFEAQAVRDPEAAAVVGERVSLSYGSLDARANRLARHLRGLGVGPEVRVGLFLERGVDLAVAIWAVLKAGGAYLPLDPEYPLERLTHMIENGEAWIIVTQESVLEKLPATWAQVVSLDGDRDLIESRKATRLDGQTDPAQLAYVMFTSGSTGAPKAILAHHRGLANFSRAAVAAYGLGPGDRVLWFLSPGFDAFGEEFYPPHCAGAALALHPNPGECAPLDLLQVCRNLDVTILHLPPVYIGEMVMRLQDSGSPPPDWIRLLITGGESLPVGKARTWLGWGMAFANAYGPAETTVTATVDVLAPSPENARERRLSIGRPVANAALYLLDPTGRPVPVGVEGELFLGGPGVTRGYHRQSALTASRYLPDPFGGPGTRMYRTGDLGRFRVCGRTDFLGRTDSQVKIRSYRIELGEVEAVLARHEAIRDVAVLAPEDGKGKRRLVAYLVSVGPNPPSNDLLRAFLKENLPDYMHPAHFVRLENMPLLPSGKIDRNALPDPSDAAESEKTAYVAPRNETERALTRIWCEVLGLERVGIHDNFFELGGDSIISIQVAARAKQQGIGLTTKQMIQYQTVSDLAEAAEPSPVEAETDEESGGPIPLTPVQQWFFQNQTVDPHHYNQSMLLQAKQALDGPALARAVRLLARHHDALRLRFRKQGSEWVQQVGEADETRAFVQADLSSLAADRQPRAVESAAASLQRSLDLTEGPLFRVAWLDLGPSARARVLIAVHHLAVDGVSWRILLEDLQRLYEAEKLGSDPELPPKTTGFASWSRRLRDFAASEEARAEAGYWERCLPRSAPFPADFPDGDNDLVSERSLSLTLGEAVTNALLTEVPRAYRTRINDVLLAALARALCAWSGEPAVIIDLEGHGREDLFAGIDLSRTLGWFTSYHPLAVAVDPDEDLGDFLKKVKERLRGIPNRGLGFAVLRHLSPDPEIRRLMAALPSAQISFNYHGQLDRAVEGRSPFEAAPEDKGPARSERGRRTHRIEIIGKVSGGRLHLAWHYSANLYRKSTVERMAQSCLDGLKEIVEHCADPAHSGFTPSDFPLAALSQRKLDTLFAGDRGIEDIYPLSPMQQGMLFHSLLEPSAGVYCAQTGCLLEGAFHEDAFQRAWARAMERHAVLRTSFLWRGVEDPVQVVHRRVALPLERMDWRQYDELERERRLSEWLEAARSRDFDLAVAPLMRLELIRLRDDAVYFIMSFHHLLADGWSWPQVLRDVFRCYSAFCEAREPELERTRPFRDYIAWLKERDPKAPKRFWTRTLRGFAAPTPLGLDTPVPGAHANPFTSGTVYLSGPVSNRIAEWARSHRLTVNTLVQAAWSVVLAHYSGSRDLVFGITVSGRPPELEGVETMVGLFINTLPLRVRIQPRQRLIEWLADLRDIQTEMIRHQYTPLTEIQGWSEVARGTPLFESILVFEKYPAPVDPETREGGGDLTMADIRAAEHTHYPVTLEVAVGGRIMLRLGSDRRRISESAAARLLEHWQYVLETMTGRGNDFRLCDLAFPPEPERFRLLTEWNRTEKVRTAPANPVARLRQWLERCPQAVALTHGGRSFSYEALAAAACRLSRRLAGHGFGQESLAGILADRGFAFTAALLAAFGSGGAYLPLEPRQPPLRLGHTLRDSGTGVVLVSRGCRTLLSEALASLPERERPLVLDVSPAGGDGEPDPGQWVENVPNEPRNLAYVIYTSGSTGIPKGAMVTYGGMVNHLLGKIEALDMNPADITAQTASQCFDISVWQHLAPLRTGGRIAVFGDEIAHDPPRLAREAARCRVTLLETVPSLLEAMLNGMQNEPRPLPLAGLRWLIPTGEALPAELCRRWHELFPAIPLLNAYGPTECSDDVTHHAVENGDSNRASRVPIGKPLPNVRLYLLDRDGQPVVQGIEAELLVGGIQVGRGYRRDPVRTATVFVPDPFSGGPGTRLYRTGDLTRYLEGGEVVFCGRLDHQLKLRGFRIEPGEIESVLEKGPAVSRAVVLLREDEPGRARLVAYVVAKGNVDVSAGEPDPAELRRFAADRLPEYMVPAAFVVLAEWPLTANGKIDRIALPAPEPEAVRADGATGLRPLEDLIAGIWCDVLHLDGIASTGHFFELGGHSLLATQVVARVREALAVEMPLRSLFETPVLGDWAARVAAEGGGHGRELPPLVPVPRTGDVSELPASFAQQRLWFLHKLEPESPSYNIARVVNLGAVDLAAVAWSAARIAHRHEVLRTTFSERNGKPFQRIHPPGAPPLPVVGLSRLNPETRETLVRATVNREAQRPFDLARGPVFRLTVLQRAQDDAVLLFTKHHIAGDGWSMGILLREFAAFYRERTGGPAANLPALPVQYADFAVWQRDWLEGEVMETQLAYWSCRLAGSPPLLKLPLDKPRPEQLRDRGAIELFSLGRELSQAVAALSRAEGVTLYITLLAAFQALLHRYSGQDDIPVGSPIAGRSRGETEHLIGFFVNTLVMRTDLSGDPGFAELLKRVRSAALEAYAHQDVPFERVVERLSPERNLGYSSLFQVLFVLENAPREAGADPGLETGTTQADTGTAKFDLTLMMSESPRGLFAGFQYNTDLFEPATIRRWIEHFKTLLARVVADPVRRLSALPLSNPEEGTRVPDGFNDNLDE